MYRSLLLRRAVADSWVLLNHPWAYIATILSFVLSMLVLRVREGHDAAKKKLRKAGISLTITAIAWFLIFVAHYLYFSPKHLYAEQKKIADRVPTLAAALDDRTHNIHPEDPAYWNLAKTIKGFTILRRSDPNGKCEVKMTIPRGQHQSVFGIVFFAADLAGCPPEAAGDLNGDPEYERKAMEDAVANAVVIHVPKDAKGGLAFYDAMSGLLDVRRSYEPFPGSAPNVVWIQFGSDVEWNSQR
jgi:hypothetical protein